MNEEQKNNKDEETIESKLIIIKNRSSRNLPESRSDKVDKVINSDMLVINKKIKEDINISNFENNDPFLARKNNNKK